VLIGFALRLLETVSLEGLEPNSYKHLSILAHVMRLTNLARRNWHGDADVGMEKIARFLSDDHLAPFAQQLKDALEKPVDVHEPPEPRSPGSTTHVSVMDEMGGCVSMTLSTGECAGYLVGDTGMCLNNLLGEHDLNPHGFHKDPAGTRLISMMTPIVLMDGDHPVLATGSAGSNRIRSALLQNISNAVDFGFEPDKAVNQARAPFEGGTLQLEAGIDVDVAARLRADGFSVNLWKEKNLYFGGAQTVGCLGGHYAGGADQRRDGAVLVID
jgi:gamma-glutamyltranspeptidase/glutathione hydrolase